MTVHNQIKRICYCCLFTAITVFSNHYLSAQKVVDVDLFSGTAQVSVPVGSVQAGDINYPLVFSYRGGGVKVDDADQRYGLGWSFSAEAGITRILRGFPDDVEFQNMIGGPLLKGWIRNTATGAAVENFSIANDDNPATCPDEGTDYSYINSNFPDHLDTEPDLFVVNVPGLSFQFLFDKNQQIKVTPYQDVKVEYTLDPLNNTIKTFTVTTDKGFKYVFAKTYPSYQFIDEVITPSTLPAFKRDYMFYRHDASGWVGYTSKWYITSITDTKTNSLQFTYDIVTNDMRARGSDKIELIKYNSVSGAYDKQYLYQKRFDYITPRINSIATIEGGMGTPGDAAVDFIFLGGSSAAPIQLMRFGKTGTTAGFTVVGPFNKTNDPNQPGRRFLSEIGTVSSGPNCYGASQTYKFTYYNVDFGSMTSYCTGVDSITNAQDYWGYYNGATANTDLKPPVWVYPDNPAVEKFKIAQIPGYAGNVVYLSGADRSVNSNAVAGSLKRIIYPNGGVSEIEYDNNEYFDSDVNGAVAGGGIRVRKVTHNDGLNTNEVTFYDYNDPVTGITSGKAVSVPDFAFSFPNATSYPTWDARVKNTTYRTFYTRSDENKYVVYGKVVVRKTNGGKSVYEFSTPGTRKTADIGDWTESKSYIARQTVPFPCTLIAPTYFINGKNQYPFPSNPNTDFDRGVVNKITNYNESGGLVSEESFTYQYANSSSIKINALKFDDVGDVRSYSKYNVITTQDNLMASRTSKTYNYTSPNPSIYTSETVSYTYPSGAATHRMPLTIQKLNSDGSTLVSRMKYAKDYTTTGTGNDAEQAIHSLKLKNNNAIIETNQSVITGGTEKYISGVVAGYKKFTIGEFGVIVPLPYEAFAFSSAAGISSGSFTSSYVNGSNNFTIDNVYYKTGTILKYDEIGNVMSATDDSRISRGSFYSTFYNLKTADFQNAKPEEMIYAPFDYPTYPYTMTTSGGSVISPGRSSTSCFELTTGATVYGTVAKATTNTEIVYSCWIKDAASSGTLTIALTGTSFSTNYYITFTADTKWKYYEIRIPKPSPASLTVTVSTNVNLKIDDVLVYPGNASVKTRSYTKFIDTHSINKGINLTAETGMNGVSASYQYDNNAMPFLIRDADDNIVQINVFRKAQADWTQLSTPGAITWSAPVFATAPVIFNSSLPVIVPCDAAVSFTWNFGDGTPEVVTSTASVPHTYATPGNYTVSCYLTAPGYLNSSTVSASPVAVGLAPVYPTICAAGIVLNSAGNVCTLAYCSPLTSVCTNTKFQVSSLSGGAMNDIEMWKWEQAPVGTSSWTTVSFGFTSTITINFSTGRPKTTSYKVRCTVYMFNGSQGVSNEVSVINNN